MLLVESVRLLRSGADGGARIAWTALTTIAVYHLVACLAFLPFFFSWTGVVLSFAGIFVFGMLGINIGYHRLLAHQGFTCPRWLERTFAVLGVCSAQESPIRWVAIHRRHHQHSDEEHDPHSPIVAFIWAHVGWLVVEHRHLDRIGLYSRYARDMVNDRFYLRLDRFAVYFGIVGLQALLFLLAGFAVAWAGGGGISESVQFGASIMLWGVFVRTVMVWHITWSVNSVTHVWGSRRYETGDQSRNNALIAIISNGEGWHNNHHADPRTAKNSRYWWELDLSYYTICLLAALGLVKDVVLPSPRIAKTLALAASPEPASAQNSSN